MKKMLTMLVLAFGLMPTVQAQQTLTVAQDGTGDYTTIQAAVDAAPADAETVIRIKAGTYAENVNIGTRQKASTQRLSFVGDGLENTIVTSAKGLSTSPKAKDIYATPAVAVYANDFYAQDITFQNTAGKSGGQALALFVSGDRQTYYRCRIAGYQDTHRSKKNTRSYYKDCIIEGATDYIYAGGTCWFEQCKLRSVAGGYITAPEDIVPYVQGEDGRIYLGFIFNGCTVERTSGVSNNSVYLGRCWGSEKCGSLFMNCNLGTNIVNAAGWQTMGGNDGKKSFYAEYKSIDDNGKAVDTSKRISWSHQLSDADYEKVNTWAKVDEAYRATVGSSEAYDPERVIAAHQSAATIDDYAPVEQRLLAFPTARGFGKFATGGRGGKVVEVTNLNDSGEGSLRWALTEAGTKDATIVFRVSGIINIGPNPSRPSERSIRAKLQNVTIAGQTAPGEGILLRGGKLNLGGSDNVVIRNLRSRLGKTDEGEFIEGGSIGIENASNIIIDHCCFGWSSEENMTMYDNHFTTVQWCIVHEGLYNAGHPKGARGYGSQWGGSPATYHHNLLAHNDSRSPRINGASNETGDRNVFLEYYNNVNYNWSRTNSCYGGENEAGTYSTHECNFVGNYYKPGAGTPSGSYFIELSAARSGKKLTKASRWFFSGNKMEGSTTATNNNWSAVNNRTGFSLAALRSDTLITTQERYYPGKNKYDYADYMTPYESADEAYEHVLARAGTIHRDAVERRVVSDVANKTYTYKGVTRNKGGIIDSPFDAEGYEPYAEATPVTDNDHDGMADDWELQNGLDPTNPDDRNRTVSAEGYTALDVYLCSLMGEPIAMNTSGIVSAQATGSVTGTELYSLRGVLLKRQSAAAGSIDLTSLPAGVYIVKRHLTDRSVLTSKVVRQ